MKSTFLSKKMLFLLSIVLFSCTPSADKMFTLMPSRVTGINFKNPLKETEQFNVLNYGYLYNGGGVAIGDINNDGLSDIYFTGNMVGSRMYLNRVILSLRKLQSRLAFLQQDCGIPEPPWPM